MGEVTGIAWTDCTANFWIGCERVSAACDFCYADRDSKRLAAQHGLKLWDGDRYITKTAASNVVKWNKRAKDAGQRRRVFCMSFGDLFEGGRAELEAIRRTVVWPLIEQCTWLDFLLLTKRPQNIRGMVPSAWLEKPLRNVWYGTTCEDQERADERIPHLLSVPAAVRFVSYEPALGPVDLRQLRCGPIFDAEGADFYDALHGRSYWSDGACGTYGPSLDWVICGGESGPHARPFDIHWALEVQNQCKETTTAFFMKQLGAKPVDVMGALKISDRAGSSMDDFPPELRVREFPVAM